MRWFKHMTNAHDDESLSRLMDEFGMEGYGAYWIILEKIASQCDSSDKTSLSLSIKNWQKSVRFSPKKLQKFLVFAASVELFSVEISENLISVSCPNLLKYRDEWARKKGKNSGATPEKLWSDSGAKNIDSDPELDKDKEKEKSPPTPPRGGDGQVKKFSPPSVQEVQAYCEDRKNGIDAQEFVDFYESKGWIIGKQRMKSWQAAVRTWEAKRRKDAPQATTSPPHIPTPKPTTFKQAGDAFRESMCQEMLRRRAEKKAQEDGSCLAQT